MEKSRYFYSLPPFWLVFKKSYVEAIPNTVDHEHILGNYGNILRMNITEF